MKTKQIPLLVVTLICVSFFIASIFLYASRMDFTVFIILLMAGCITTLSVFTLINDIKSHKWENRRPVSSMTKHLLIKEYIKQSQDINCNVFSDKFKKLYERTNYRLNHKS